jgi:formylglycine-generating enzyme required for sulfatase activity
MNADPAHIRRTSPVGVFVESDTPDGLVDMAGNVWEWTSSAYTERYDPVSPITACQDDSARRVVRGGSWFDTSGHCRASYRGGNDPDNRLNDLGLRLVRRLGPHSEPGSPDHRASDATPSR